MDYRIKDARFVATAPKADLAPSVELPEVAFAGRSNAGKSSLINALVARKSLARTSSDPGRTRLLQFFRVGVVPGGDLSFADLPGYGYAKRSKSERASWKKLVESYFASRSVLCAAVLVSDIRRELGDEELQFVDYAQSVGVRPVVALSKADRCRPNERVKLARDRRQSLLSIGMAPSDIVQTSSAKREGIDALWGRIFDAVHSHTPLSGSC